MTESEKIAYAKVFIDKLANGINPLDDTPIPEDDLANNVRLSRCFGYVSLLLARMIRQERQKENRKKRRYRPPYSLSPEQLEKIEFSATPI